MSDLLWLAATAVAAGSSLYVLGGLLNPRREVARSLPPTVITDSMRYSRILAKAIADAAKLRESNPLRVLPSRHNEIDGAIDYSTRGRELDRGAELLSLEEAHRSCVEQARQQRMTGEVVYFAGEGTPLSRAKHNFLLAGVPDSGKTRFLLAMMKGLLPAMRDPDAHIQRAVIHDPKNEYYPALRALGVEDEEIFLTYPYDQRSYSWDVARDIVDPRQSDALAEILVEPSDSKHHETRNDSEAKFFQQASVLVLSGVIENLRHTAGQHWSLLDLLLCCTEKNISDVLRMHDFGRELIGYIEGIGEKRTEKSVLLTLANVTRRFRTPVTAWEHAYRQGRRLSLKSWVETGSGVVVLGRDDEARHPVDRLNQAMFTRISRVLLSQETGGSPRTWFFIDEMAQGPPFPDLADLVVRGRDHGAVTAIAFQSLAALRMAGYTDHEIGAIFEAIQNHAVLKLGTDVAQHETSHWASALTGKADYYEFTRRFDKSKGKSHTKVRGTTEQETEAITISSDGTVNVARGEQRGSHAGGADTFASGTPASHSHSDQYGENRSTNINRGEAHRKGVAHQKAKARGRQESTSDSTSEQTTEGTSEQVHFDRPLLRPDFFTKTLDNADPTRGIDAYFNVSGVGQWVARISPDWVAEHTPDPETIDNTQKVIPRPAEEYEARTLDATDKKRLSGALKGLEHPPHPWESKLAERKVPVRYLADPYGSSDWTDYEADPLFRLGLRSAVGSDADWDRDVSAALRFPPPTANSYNRIYAYEKEREALGLTPRVNFSHLEELFRKERVLKAGLFIQGYSDVARIHFPRDYASSEERIRDLLESGVPEEMLVELLDRDKTRGFGRHVFPSDLATEGILHRTPAATPLPQPLLDALERWRKRSSRP